MKSTVVVLSLLLISTVTKAELILQTLVVKDRGNMAIGIYPSEVTPRADILYFHGHGDRLRNHEPIFRRWAEAGYRTLSFDLPQHGGSMLGPLDSYSMDELADLATILEKYTREDEHRPLVFVGWSFGGLLATRFAQQLHSNLIGRKLSALFLITPAIAPLPFSGGDGISRLATLTSNKQLQQVSKPSPQSPLSTPLFALRTLHAAWTARQMSLPSIPVTVVLAGKQNDWYVDTEAVHIWAVGQSNSSSKISVWQCQHARHALELEPYPTGHWLQEFSSAQIGFMLDSRPASSIDYWNGAFNSGCRHAS